MTDKVKTLTIGEYIPKAIHRIPNLAILNKVTAFKARRLIWTLKAVSLGLDHKTCTLILLSLFFPHFFWYSPKFQKWLHTRSS